MRTSEQDVLMAWMPLVTAAVQRLSPLERDDRVQVASMGLLYAIRTWRIGMPPFGHYARDCIAAHLAQANSDVWRIKRAESRLSLDQPMYIGGERVGTYADVLLTTDKLNN